MHRVESTKTAQEVGAEQIQALAKARSTFLEALDMVGCDGKYGNSGFLCSVKGLHCGIVARLRCDRVLRQAPPLPSSIKKRGRPKVHGSRFAFKEPETWGTPNEVIELQDDQWGQVRLERWNQLHEQKGTDVPYDVVRARVHLEREPSPALWLAWLPPQSVPQGQEVNAETIWRAYDHRWPIEPGFHFCKETLGWTMPMFQSKEAGDRWAEITALAAWMVYLARPLVEDMPYSWQKSQLHLTPQRVQQSLRPVLAQISSPARPPKSRGKASGWPKGKSRTPKQRFPVVKKTPVTTKTA